MYQSRILSSLILSLVMVTPACGSKFVSLGDEDAGTRPDGTPGSGGSSWLGIGGGSPVDGAGGSGPCVCTGDAPKMVSYACPDGSMAGPVCERDVVDECNWVIRDCPSTSGAGGSAGVGGAVSVGGSSATCLYNGVYYTEGQSFPAIDGCNTCFCTAVGVACTQYNVC
jgi:hypothetical protein